MSTKEEAKQAVQRIARKYGHLREDMLEEIEGWNPQIRREIEENWLAMESMAAHSIKTLAKQIYGSGARFIFELLQNADDNRFTRALGSSDVPYISFKVYHDRIIVDCNEDGFSENDLIAICAVGQSTKSASYGYIGAKGIGFKSVFIAASKVEIRSGHFSFYFSHEKGDSGLGMVIPRWQDKPQNMMQAPLTRMVLHLHTKGDPVEVAHLKETIFQQLNDLQQTCLLFLKKLRRIQITFHDSNGLEENRKEFNISHSGNMAKLYTKILDNTGERNEVQNYHVTSHTVHNLPKSDSRELPNSEEARRISSTTEVILAFPLTAKMEPHIAKQHVFAFLPVRESDFSFLIQSDFDTSANRQDIITTSRRNLAIRDGVASAFIKGVLEFCEHPDLCYTWPGFLPSPDESVAPFWSALVERIRRLMANTPILKSRHRAGLRLIADVCILGNEGKDVNLQPLFDDSIRDPFLADRYAWKHIQNLKKYGLFMMSADLHLDMMEIDLRSPHSRMKAVTTNQEWHSTATILPLRIIQENGNLQSRLERISLLPLRNDEWVSATNGPTYLPTTRGHKIPPHLDLQVLDSSAVSNLDRKKLFIALGATEAPVLLVRRAIWRAFERATQMDSSLSKQFLHFLYLTHSPILIEAITKIWVVNSGPYLLDPRQKDIYFPATGQYSPKSLLKASGNNPGFEVAFIQSDYLQDTPKPPHADHPTWEKWDGQALSEAFTFVAKHRPEKFLGLLKHLWNGEEAAVTDNEVVRLAIRKLPARDYCDASSDFDESLTLDQCWLPHPILRQQVGNYMGDLANFPFLDMDPAELLTGQWSFLSDCFQVKSQNDLDFLLEILSWECTSNPVHSRDGQIQRLCRLYVAIGLMHALETNQQATKLKIRRIFEEQGLILAIKNSQLGWYKSSDCLWSSTTEIRGKATISHHYEELKSFFVDTLGVKDLTLRMVYDELRSNQPKSLLDVQSALWSFNSLLQTEEEHLDRAPLLKSHIFPVKYPNGGTELRSADVEFAIVDRQHLGAAFRENITYLDFNLEEVRFLQPFLKWANLEHRYLSNSVRQFTSVSEGPTRPISSRQYNLKLKAHPILRIAATFKSPRYQLGPEDFYTLLREIKVTETSGISSIWKFSQGGKSFEVAESAGDTHIRETTSGLTIYVPMNKRAQSVCFSSSLPRTLADWLLRDPVTQIRDDSVVSDTVNALTAVLAINCLHSTVFEQVLSQHGVIDTPVTNQDDVDDDDEDEDDEGDVGYGAASAASADVGDNHDTTYGFGTDSSTPVVMTPSSESVNGLPVATSPLGSSFAQSQLSRTSNSASREQPLRVATYSPATSSDHQQTAWPSHTATALEDAQYLMILNNIVHAAQTATIPAHGAFDLSGMGNALPVHDDVAAFDAYDGSEVVSRFRSSSQLERDKKIGAAGELFVFVMLDRLLADWSRDNWKSTIRYYTRIHPEFSDLHQWIGRETADFVYDDVQGHLTGELIENGYLPQQEWAQARPKYYIEVKTTTGPCETPFYMSRNQFQLMRDKHSTRDHSEVYMILRVYRANSDRVGIRVYVDPEQLRRDGDLLFTGETWSIVPGHNTGS